MTTSIRFFHWIPRSLGILAILFISMFALDSFGVGMSMWQQFYSLLMHLIPSVVLILFLAVAWKWELVGGIIFVCLGLGFMPFIYMMNFQMNHSAWMSLGVILAINLPFIVVGILFILSHFLQNINSKSD